MTISAVSRLNELLSSGRRVMLGVVGPPGAGKSTLAAQLQAAFATRAQVLPMDGFHLATSQLRRLGRMHRQGAPDTFDAAGYVALLQRVRWQGTDEVVYAPDFNRELGEPIAGAIAVEPRTQLLIAEGNYLLLEQGDWAKVRGLLDEAWYVDVDDTLRRSRLIERHVQFGRTHEQACAWVEQTDEPNARLIAASRHRADRVVRLRDGEGDPELAAPGLRA